jgi:hypothetical protein
VHAHQRPRLERYGDTLFCGAAPGPLRRPHRGSRGR